MESQPVTTRRTTDRASYGRAATRRPGRDDSRADEGRGSGDARGPGGAETGPTDALVDERVVGWVVVPEDVRAELDADARLLKAETRLNTPAAEVPEDVLSELDREGRLGHEEAMQRLAEGEPPAEDDLGP
jgi:hypothetical protein